ncbi:MAG: hypothetical protein J0G94_08955 [Sphingomonadales bacterium]|nr:hypothetical protein [Sphingomonadales bacterium]
MRTLEALVGSELRRPAMQGIVEVARRLNRKLRGDAVLFYGSALSTGDLDGVLDFYVLQDRPRRGLMADFLWPHVSYHEFPVAGRTLRAKVATMPLAIFEAAARGGRMDTTIWARFAQPSRLLVSRSPAIAARVVGAVCDCLRTATRFAAALGPASGTPGDYWRALFQQTYGAEFRVEQQARADIILDRDPDYYRDALLLAWQDMKLIAQIPDGPLHPAMEKKQRATWRARWRRRRMAGKPLNVARLIKAAWTFEGATRYALWKIERHSGVAIALTPWRERHPVLAAPGVLIQLWRAGRK